MLKLEPACKFCGCWCARINIGQVECGDSQVGGEAEQGGDLKEEGIGRVLDVGWESGGWKGGYVRMHSKILVCKRLVFWLKECRDDYSATTKSVGFKVANPVQQPLESNSALESRNGYEWRRRYGRCCPLVQPVVAVRLFGLDLKPTQMKF